MSPTKRLRVGLSGVGLAGALLASTSAFATPVVAITEWMYNGEEFIEFTNMSTAPVDFAGWSFDDDSRTPGVVSLSDIGILAPGASALLTESAAAAFRTRWGLDSAVAIVGSNATNLGRGDEINLYNNANALVDRLTYGDLVFPGTIQTLNISGNPTTYDAIGANNVAGWALSQVGDNFGSYVGTGTTFVANPGKFLPPVPLPAALPLLLSGLVGFAAVRRRARERLTA